MTGTQDYFARDPSLAATDKGRYFELLEVDPVEFTPGLEFRPVIGERMLVNFVRYQPNTMAPVHAHEEEQVTFVVDGEFEFDLDGDVRVMRPGMAVLVPPGVPHGAKTQDTPCYEIDVFSPPRRVLVEATRLAANAEEIVVEPPGGG